MHFLFIVNPKSVIRELHLFPKLSSSIFTSVSSSSTGKVIVVSSSTSPDLLAVDLIFVMSIISLDIVCATFNSATLPRFSTLHGSVLAAAIILCLFILIQFRKSVFVEYLSDMRFIITMLVSLVLFFGLVSRFSAPLELPADLADIEYNPRPEWYFLWLFQFGKYVEWAPWIQSGILPLFGVGFLFAVPWLRNHGQKRRYAFAMSWCLVWLVLTGLAIVDDKDLHKNPNYSDGMAFDAEKNFNRL